jgi:gluconate kinase/nickel-dependent lactate racemase
VGVGRIVVTGVAGSGKSTLAGALSDRFGVPLLDADGFHPDASVAKMAAGVPLDDDDDRRPWLAELRMAMRDGDEVVVACPALRRSYRDALRAAGGVRFLHLDGSPGEPPGEDETDVAVLPADDDPVAVLAAAERVLASLRPGTAVSPLFADGGVDRVITPEQLDEHVRRIAEQEIVGAGARRVLLVPPDHTRLHSRSGEIAGCLYETLTAAGCDVWVLPALGTHIPMSPAEADLLFGDRIPYERLLVHRWLDGLERLGEISAAEVAMLSGGRYAEAIPVESDEQLFEAWDLVVSIGQVVPHEVIGTAGFTKNVVIGLGGGATIHRSHFLGAVCDMEKIMGRAESPVRDAIDAAFDRFLVPRLNVLWLLTVTEDTVGGVIQRGLFAGRGGSGDSGRAAYQAAAELARLCNVTIVPEPLGRVTCWLSSAEYRTTWLANKAVYRTRMALTDGGELIVLAPGVARFGEDPWIDTLIRRHGYRGTPATLAAVKSDPDLAASLGSAAHLIHGSSEGRFGITYCTDPDDGGLGAEEVEGVGYRWRLLPAELERLGVDGTTPTGPRRDRDGEPFFHIANPSLGLWARG